MVVRVGCVGRDCTSYLLTGGLEMVVPWTPHGYGDYSMAKIEQAPSTQLDFTSVTSGSFLDGDYSGLDFITNPLCCASEPPLPTKLLHDIEEASGK